MLFRYAGTIQEEVHRFAIEYQRSLRRSGTVKSQLESIPGVGTKRREALLRPVRCIAAIREADVDQLAEVIPRSAAEAVYQHFHSEGEST